MLKITNHADGAGSGTVLALEGQIAGEWVAELRRACRSHPTMSGPLTFDFTGVTFIDRAGLEFLDEVYPGVTLINCSLFAAEQLRPVIERHDAGRR